MGKTKALVPAVSLVHLAVESECVASFQYSRGVSAPMARFFIHCFDSPLIVYNPLSHAR